IHSVEAGGCTFPAQPASDVGLACYMQTLPATVDWQGTGNLVALVMRRIAMLVASAHLCLAACQTAPNALLPPPPGGASLLASTPATAPAPAPTNHSAAPTPYMRCVNDFWGNCTGVASNRHDYRWRYVRPGARPRELRESATARANLREKEPGRETG